MCDIIWKGNLSNSFLFFVDDVNIDDDWLDLTIKQEDTCAICKKELKDEPIVKCDECFCLDLCVQCFSLGLETQQHRNFHRYRVDRRHSPVFPTSDWPAELEMDLLNAIFEFGYGNWSDISKRIIHKTQDEIRKHFNKYYLDNHDHLPEFPVFSSGLRTSYKTKPLYQYNPCVVSEEPPRFPSHSYYCRYFAGYNAPRGDFEIEYDNYAESLLTNIDFEEVEDDPDNDLLKELKLALIQQYNECLKERLHRKRIIRNHGLLLVRKFPIMQNKYEGSITKSQLDRLYPFMQLVSGEKFDFILEGLDKEVELKRYFFRLKGFRESGLTRFFSCKVYEKLKASREEMMKELHQLRQNPLLSLKHVNLDVKPSIKRTIVSSRKPAPPLNVQLMPGYEKLTEEERELCSNARIVPESFLTFRDILINESKKNNGIRLATARQIIKIDVNKTRKLFNFLRDKELITQIS